MFISSPDKPWGYCDQTGLQFQLRIWKAARDGERTWTFKSRSHCLQVKAVSSASVHVVELENGADGNCEDALVMELVYAPDELKGRTAVAFMGGAGSMVRPVRESALCGGA